MNGNRVASRGEAETEVKAFTETKAELNISFTKTLKTSQKLLFFHFARLNPFTFITVFNHLFFYNMKLKNLNTLYRCFFKQPIINSQKKM